MVQTKVTGPGRGSFLMEDQLSKQVTIGSRRALIGGCPEL